MATALSLIAMPTFTLPYNSPLGLITLAIAIIGAGTIGLAVRERNPKSATNNLFTLLTLCTVLWMLDTYVVRIPELIPISLFLHRLGIFFAAPMSLFLFLLGHTMPEERMRMRPAVLWSMVALTVGMMLVNLSPYAFTSAVIIQGASEPQAGLGLLPFAIISTVFSGLSVLFLIRSFRRSTDVARKQVGIMLFGILLLLGLIIVTVLFPLIVWESTVFLPLVPLYVLAFLGTTAYAITRYQLFNIKVLLTQSLVIIIDVVLLGKLFGETSSSATTVDLFVLAFMLVFGFFLVRSVKNEVRQRELIETQEKELEVSNARLRELDKQKSEFLSFASHQLRTPLTAIKWSAGTLTEGSYGAVPEYLREPVRTILEESERMTVMVNDYLNVSRIEQGRMQYTFSPVDLGALLTTVTTELRSAVEAKGLTLQSDVGAERTMVWGDAGKLNQVFSNIIDNALKYTPHGSITVTLKKFSDRGLAHVEVRDTGIGMDAATREKIFEKFMRGDNAQEVNNGGSGLGLFIVRTFVEAHKGNIWADSQGEGSGTVFIVELPLLVQK